MNISHVKSNTVGDFTGTVTVLNSAGLAATVLASALVLPSDWNSAHAQALTIRGNTAGQSTWSGTNLDLQGGNNVTLSLAGNTLVLSGPTVPAQSVQTQGMVSLQGSTGAIVLSNSNGLTFGGAGSVITASHNGITSQTIQTQGSVAVQGSTGAITFSNSNGITFGGAGSTITASHNGLTSQSNQAVSAGNGSSAFQTLSFADGSGVSWSTAAGGLGASVRTDYASSSHSHGNPTLALTNLSGTTASNSAGLTLSLSAAAAGGGGGAAISAAGSSQNAGTVVFSNSNGVSFGMNGSTITATVTPGAAAGVAAVSAGTQQATSGTLAFANSNGLTFGLSGSSQLTASHNGITQQSTQPVAVSGSNGSYAFSTLSFSNANGMSFGTSAGSALTASYTVPTVTNSTFAVSDAASSASVGRLAFTNLNGVTLSLSTGAGGSHTIVGSHNGLTTAAASNHSHGNPTLALTNLSGTTASNSAGLTLSLSAAAPGAGGGAAISAAGGSQSTGTIVFSNSNGVSFGFNAGTITATVQPGAAAGLAAGAAGTQSATSGTLNFVDSNGITFGMSGSSQITASHNGLTTARASNDAIGLATAGTNVTWTANSAGLSLNAGGYAGTGFTSTTTAGTALAATHNTAGLSLAFPSWLTTAMASNAATISNIKISAGTASANASAFTFADGNGISFGLGTGASVGSITASHNALTTARASTDAVGLNTALTANGVSWTVNSSGISLNVPAFLTTAAVSTHSHGNPTLALTNISGTTASASNGLTLSLSANAPGAATLSAFAVGNTTQSSSGTIPGSLFSVQGAGGVSAGVSNGSLVLSGPTLTSLAATGALSASSNGSTISLGVGTVTISATSNTTQASSGTVNLNGLILAGAGGASVGISNGSIVISGGAGGGGGVGLSAGTQSVSTGTVVFSNSNGITFGMSGSSQVTASYNSTQFAGTGTTFAGANASASMTLNSAGLNLSVSVAAPGAAAEANAHNLLGANTAGNTTATGSTIGLSGLNLTLSGTNGSQIVLSAPATSSLVGASGLSVSTNGGTISIYQGVALSRFLFEPPGASSAGSAMTQGSLSLQRVVIAENISFSRVDIPAQISLASSATANTGNLLISSGCMIYTASGSTLSPLVGAFGTTTYTHASNTANFNSVTGPRFLSFPIATALTPGEYFVGVQLSTNNNSSIGTATTALAATISLQHGAIYTASQWAEFGAVTATSINMRPFVGVAASVTATQQTVQMSQVTQTGTALMRANIAVGFRNV